MANPVHNNNYSESLGEDSEELSCGSWDAGSLIDELSPGSDSCMTHHIRCASMVSASNLILCVLHTLSNGVQSTP